MASPESLDVVPQFAAAIAKGVLRSAQSTTPGGFEVVGAYLGDNPSVNY